MAVDNKDVNKESALMANRLGEIKLLISTISKATDPLEVELLKRMAEGFISELGFDAPELKSNLASAVETASVKIETAQQTVAVVETKKVGKISSATLRLMTDEDLLMTDAAINLASMAAIMTLAEGSLAEKSNIKDTAFAPLIEAIEMKEAKEEHRQQSKDRVEGLKKLGEFLASPEAASQPEVQDSLIEEAAKFKIKIERSESGELKIDDKSKKALDKIAQLDFKEIEEKREERKERDLVDNFTEALSFGGISSLFGGGDDDDYTPEAPRKTQDVSIDAAPPTSVPEEMRVSSPVTEREPSYSPVPAKGGTYVEAASRKKEQEKSSGRGV